MLLYSPTWLFSFIPSASQEFDQLEFFAGVGNLTRQARSVGYRSIRFDILDTARSTRKTKRHKTNFMDLTSPSGFAYLWRSANFLYYCNVFLNLFGVQYYIFQQISSYNSCPGWLSCAFWKPRSMTLPCTLPSNAPACVNSMLVQVKGHRVAALVTMNTHLCAWAIHWLRGLGL